MEGSQLHEAASDCICVILQALYADNNANHDSENQPSMQLRQLQSCLFANVMNLEQPYHLSVAHEDTEK